MDTVATENNSSRNIAFFIRHFTERGTEVAVYDYANYNEKILHNNSYIIYFGEFSSKNKPIITGPCGDIEHIKILGNKAIIYKNKEQLLNIF